MYVFNQAIHNNPGEGVLVSLLQASIPYSFYNIRAGSNDTLAITVVKDGATANYTITVPAGNYTVTSLAQKLKEDIETQWGTARLRSLSPVWTRRPVDFHRSWRRSRSSTNPAVLLLILRPTPCTQPEPGGRAVLDAQWQVPRPHTIVSYFCHPCISCW
eukprot:SAG22_NODE_2909_length_2110_cov_3.407757_2_plen_159_part_00